MPADDGIAPAEVLEAHVATALSGRAQPESVQVGEPAVLALEHLPVDVFDQDETARIATTRQRIAEEDLYVVAIGEFKRGKSTLLNALTGQPILPVGVVPLTSVVTVLRRGPARAVAWREDGSTVAIDAARLADFVTEGGNPGNRQRLARVEVRSPDLKLPPHVALIDTPGLGSVYESGSDHTLEFLPQLDVALVVLSVDQPLTEAEERLAARLRDQGTELLFAVNKTDYLSPAEIDEALGFVAERLAHVGFSHPPVFGVSAKAALRGDPASGVGQLRERLTALVETRYESIHAAQSLRRAGALLDELETTYALRAEIAARGESELDSVLRALERSRGEIARLAEEQDALFAHRIQMTEHRLGDRMREFQTELKQRLLAALKVMERPEEEPTERRADELMAAVIAPALAEAAQRETPVLETALQEGYERLLAGLDDLANALARRTTEILGVPIARPHHSERVTSAPIVSVKLRDDPVVLELLTGALQSPLPRRLRRRLVARRSRERAGELANLHAGRLRSELARGLREATRLSLYDAHEEIDTISSSIEKAIEQGVAQRNLAAGAAQAARERVALALDSLRAARTVLLAGAPREQTSG